ERRRAAAEEHRLHFPFPQGRRVLQAQIHLRDYCAGVGLLRYLAGNHGGEIAVGTLAQAKGEVQVDAEPRRADSGDLIEGACARHRYFLPFSCASSLATLSFSEAAASRALSAATSFFFIEARSALSLSRSARTSVEAAEPFGRSSADLTRASADSKASIRVSSSCFAASAAPARFWSPSRSRRSF